jgi:hypothetical protein
MVNFQRSQGNQYKQKVCALGCQATWSLKGPAEMASLGLPQMGLAPNFVLPWFYLIWFYDPVNLRITLQMRKPSSESSTIMPKVKKASRARMWTQAAWLQTQYPPWTRLLRSICKSVCANNANELLRSSSFEFHYFIGPEKKENKRW